MSRTSKVTFLQVPTSILRYRSSQRVEIFRSCESAVIQTCFQFSKKGKITQRHIWTARRVIEDFHRNCERSSWVINWPEREWLHCKKIGWFYKITGIHRTDSKLFILGLFFQFIANFLFTPLVHNIYVIFQYNKQFFYWNTGAFSFL